jgi:hypothetical protein
MLLDPSNLLLFVLGLGVLALKLWALVDACVRPAPAYQAAGKLSKIAWIAILVAAVLLGGANVLGLFGLLGTVAAIVYLVDVRPAVRSMRPGGPWA